MSYNGWKNYETWAMGMWLDGNYDGEGTYHETQALVRETFEAAEATPYRTLSEARKFNTADALKEYAEARVRYADGLEGVTADLLGAAFDEVDWHELAEAQLAEVAETVE